MNPSKTYLLPTTRGDFFLRENGNPTDFPVIFLHGWPQSSYCWEAVCQHLDGKGFRLIRPDLRGMGDSLRTLELEDYRKKNLAQDIAALLNALELEKILLVGHDWGGIVAQELALAMPEKIAGLVLLNISVINNATGILKAQEKIRKENIRYLWYQFFMQTPQLPEALIAGKEEVWLRTFLRFANKNPFPEEAIAEYVRTFKIKNTLTTSANLYRTLAQDMQDWANWQQKQAQFQMPLLYLYGDKDPIIVAEYLEGLENCGKEVVSLQTIEAGHFLAEEQPDWVAKQFIDFFNTYIL